ncbi:hypothetical protein N7535_005810 [Penicillium sp. DV-2018c]|nr:hypothetical protein N7461_009385 [Penicillium sp. DV-2018c]KAJ5572150.1 hypothetical protein N7535_005810 [Penicillium sp. DV-2018c]
MDYVTRGVCGQEGCRETRYYLDNGLWYCRRGHLQEGVQVAEDADDFGNLGKTHRLKKEIKEKISKTLRGRPAYTLFLQTYQLILWKQCHALVHDQGFPEELEIVVRDLWALRLQDFTAKITDTTEDEDYDTEPELFSSQPGEKDDSRDMGFKAGSKYIEWPRLIDTIALCYLAAFLMRLPVCVNDFHHMIIRQDVPYVRALATVPREMRDRLPPEFTGILEVNTLPKAKHIHESVRATVLFYQRRFGLELPPLNLPMILFRQIKRLALPIEAYDAAKALQELVGFTFKYPEPESHDNRRINQYPPDVQLMVLIVIATKLLFPIDDLKRYPTTSQDPSAQVMDWPQWARAQSRFDHDPQYGDNLAEGSAIHVTDQDVLNMTPAQMDNYMDWYASSWLDTSRAPTRIAELFPIGRTGPDAQPIPTATPGSSSAPTAPDTTEEKLNALMKTVMQNLKARRVIPEDEEAENRRPGEWYRRYRWESQLTGPARTFYETAAHLAAVPLKSMVHVVSLVEFKIAKQDEERQNREFFARQGREGLASDGSDVDDTYGMDDSEEDMDEPEFEMGADDKMW